MMKKYLFSALVFLISAQIYAQSTPASRQELSRLAEAGSNASGNIVNGVVASGRLTSAISAVPLSVGAVVLGSAATVISEAATESAKLALIPIGQPLPVSDQVVTTMPPNEALKKTN